MKYKELLSELVKNSGLTLREIAEKCKEHNLLIDPSYISKLQTGKQAPPSNDVSRTLAEVLGGDPLKLSWLGFIEKAPYDIQQSLRDLNPRHLSEMSQKHGIKFQQVLNLLVKDLAQSNEADKTLKEKYPSKPTIQQVREDKDLQQYRVYTDEFLQRYIDAKYLTAEESLDPKWIAYVASWGNAPHLSDEFKEETAIMIDFCKNLLSKRGPSLDEINSLLKKFANLPERDRKEIFYLATLKEEYIQKRVLDMGAYILDTHATEQQVAQVFEVSLKTVYNDMFERLPLLDEQMAQEVKRILDSNKTEQQAIKKEA